MQEALAAAMPPGSSTGASGIHTLSCNGPAEPARNAATHAAMRAGGSLSSTPSAPMPPASATAIASSGELAPAIGASRIGSARP